MAKNNRTCSDEWLYLAKTLCQRDKSDPFIANKYCQLYCSGLGTEYYDDCTGEPEVCCTSEPTPTPSTSPVVEPNCMYCTNQRPKATGPLSMIANNRTCSWGGIPCDNGGNYWTTNKWCQYSCWSQGKPYANDEKPCCDISSICVPCDDNPSIWMVNNLPSTTNCENWGGVTEAQCLRDTFQSSKSCQQSCYDIHNIQYNGEICCPL